VDIRGTCAHRHRSVKLTIKVALLDLVANLLGATSVDLATNGEAGAEDLKDRTLQLP